MAERGPIFVRLELRGTSGEPALLSRILACDDAISSAAGIKDPGPPLSVMTEERNLLMQENHRLKGELEATTRKAREVNKRLNQFLGEGPRVQEEVDRRVILLLIHPCSRTENTTLEATAYLVILKFGDKVQVFQVGVTETEIHGQPIYVTNGDRALAGTDIGLRRDLYAAVTAYHQKKPLELPLVIGEDKESSE